MKMPAHLFVSSDNGDLFDTRLPQWSTGKPLRYGYKGTFPHIDSTHRFKATLRAGAFAWPGGYPLFLICDDGGAPRNILQSIAANAGTDGESLRRTSIGKTPSSIATTAATKFNPLMGRTSYVRA
jgi:hypothetical protein